MSMIYITFERGGPIFSNSTARALAYCTVSFESKIATMQHMSFCVRDFIKTESAIAVQHAFCFRFNIQPPKFKHRCEYNQM